MSIRFAPGRYSSRREPSPPFVAVLAPRLPRWSCSCTPGVRRWIWWREWRWASPNIDWPAKEQAEPQKSKLDERFLRTKLRSLPFFPDLHIDMSRSWARLDHSRPAYSSQPPITMAMWWGCVSIVIERCPR